MWHAIKADGEQMIIPSPCEDKDMAVSLIKALFELESVETFVFMSEAWISTTRDRARISTESTAVACQSILTAREAISVRGREPRRRRADRLPLFYPAAWSTAWAQAVAAEDGRHEKPHQRRQDGRHAAEEETAMKKLLLVTAMTVISAAAMAQQRTFYDASGRNVGTAATDRRCSTTFRDSMGSHHRPAARPTVRAPRRCTMPAGALVGRATGGKH